MKKTYKNPTLTVVNVQAARLMAGSPGYGGTTTKTSGNFGRQGNFSGWNEEEE